MRSSGMALISPRLSMAYRSESHPATNTVMIGQNTTATMEDLARVAGHTDATGNGHHTSWLLHIAYHYQDDKHIASDN